MKSFFWFLFLTNVCFAQIDRNGDFQIWNREMVALHFSGKWSLFSFAESRIGDNGSKLYEAILHTELGYKPTSWIWLGPGYRQAVIRSPLNSNYWEPIYSPIFNLTLFFKINRWELIDRNRVQYQMQKSNPYPWLYRNRFRIVPPWAMTRFCINPFVDNEIFIRQGRGFTEDRVSAGFIFWLQKNLSGQLYYTCRFQKTSHWIHQNVLNITVLLAY